MKLIVAGGRNYQLSAMDYIRLRRIRPVEEIVSGGASGADACGELYARTHDIPVKIFRADWSKGRAAGPMRNLEMALYADAVALFPGGKGTESMYKEARRVGIRIYDFRDKESLQGELL